MKELADCVFYGLKGERQDPVKALKLYKEAADLNHPEAVTFYSRNLYQTMVMDWDLMSHEDIPRNKAKDIDQKMMEKMWFYLEKVAILNWISPFFVQQARQAADLKTCKLTNMVQDAMDRWKSGEVLDHMVIMHMPPCSNKECYVFMADAALVVHCNRCLFERYCSKRCEYKFKAILLGQLKVQLYLFASTRPAD